MIMVRADPYINNQHSIEGITERNRFFHVDENLRKSLLKISLAACFNAALATSLNSFCRIRARAGRVVIAKVRSD
jgi:hypothetical protein